MPAIGAAGILAALVVLFDHWRDAESRREQAWLLPGAPHGFLRRAVTAIGRVPLGLQAMTAGRYVVFTALFWIGLMMLLTVRTPYRSRAARGASFVRQRSSIVAGSLRAWGDALPFMEHTYVTGVLGREALLRTDWAQYWPRVPVARALR